MVVVVEDGSTNNRTVGWWRVGLYGEDTSGVKPSSTGQPGTGKGNNRFGNYSCHGDCGGGGGR